MSFDELGSPWPKHGCFDDDRYGTQLRSMLADEGQRGSAIQFGVVIETVAASTKSSEVIIIRCSNGDLMAREFATSRELASLLGRLTVVIGDEQGRSLWKFVEPPVVTRPQWRSMREFAMKPGFPGNAKGQTVLLNGRVGQVVEILEGGRKFRFRFHANLHESTFVTSYVVKLLAQSKTN